MMTGQGARSWTYSVGMAAWSGVLVAVGSWPLVYSTCQDFSHMAFYSILPVFITTALGAIVSIYGHSIHRYHQARYLIDVLCRYGLAYLMVYFAMLFTEGEHWTLNLTMQDSKVADLTARDITTVFMGYSDLLPYAIGGTLIASAALLMFRRTAIIGIILGLGLWVPLTLIDYSFDQCTLGVSAIATTSLVLLALPHLRRLLPALMGYRVETAVSYPLLGRQLHIYRSLGVLKLCLVAGLMVHVANGIWHFQKYYRSNDDSPIVGVWDVIDVQYASDSGELRRDTIPLEIASFKSLFLEESRYGAVKGSEDTLSRFEYIVDSSYNQLELWNFWEFKNLDLKGKYHMQDQDTMIYEGTNRKEAIRMVLKRNPKYKAHRGG